nr:C-type lectin domain family 4 member E isoform X2 [Taeniopygia guttata]
MNSQGRISPGTAEERSCPWLNIWVFLIFVLPIKAALVTICLVVVPFSHSSDQPSALQQQFSKWECNSAVPQGTERGWTCCPKGWRRFQRSCYFLSLDRMNCAESVQNCTGMGSQLVVITSKAEQEFLYKQKTPSTKRDNIYIGLLKDTVVQWQWVDKTPYNGTPMFWRQGEPSDNLDENCTVMHVPEGNLNNWNNVKPYTMHHRICEAAAVIV